MAPLAEFTPEGVAVIAAMTAVIALLTYLVRRCYDRWDGHPPPRRPPPRRKRPPPPDRS